MVQYGMHKTKAIESLGGSIASAAAAIGISYQAVAKWPEQLPARIADRVTAAATRIKTQGKAKAKTKPAPQSQAA